MSTAAVASVETPVAAASIAETADEPVPVPPIDYSFLPLAGANGGKTKPCHPHRKWNQVIPYRPDGGYRIEGKLCSDVKPVTLPVCSDSDVARAERVDVRARPPDDDFWQRPSLIRGHLRRHRLQEPSMTLDTVGYLHDYDRSWSLRLESAGPHGRCVEEELDRSKLCISDSSVSCCSSPVDSEGVEVIVRFVGVGPQPPPDSHESICVIGPVVASPEIKTDRRPGWRGGPRKPRGKGSEN